MTTGCQVPVYMHTYSMHFIFYMLIYYNKGIKRVEEPTLSHFSHDHQTLSQYPKLCHTFVYPSRDEVMTRLYECCEHSSTAICHGVTAASHRWRACHATTLPRHAAGYSGVQPSHSKVINTTAHMVLQVCGALAVLPSHYKVMDTTGVLQLTAGMVSRDACSLSQATRLAGTSLLPKLS